MSVRGRTYRYILVNDGSTDTSRQIISQAMQDYPEQLVVVDQENAGEASAVNRGIELVPTPYFCVVNADDPLLPGHGATMTGVLENSPQVVVAYPDWKMLDSSGRVLRTVRTKNYDIRALVGDFVCLPGPGAVIRRDVVKGRLRNDSYRYISDFESWIRLSMSGPFIRVPEVLATWRQHQAGATSSGAGSQIADELVRLASEDLQTILPNGVFKRFRRTAMSHALYYAALQLNNAGEKGGRQMMMRSIIMKPFPSCCYKTDHRHMFIVISVFLGKLGDKLICYLGNVRQLMRSVLQGSASE
jgi:glycosyltransferase involved in cell wall biosynthesis